jgi:hypothetical protein
MFRIVSLHFYKSKNDDLLGLQLNESRIKEKAFEIGLVKALQEG